MSKHDGNFKSLVATMPQTLRALDASSNASPTDGFATSRVFGVTELLENILLSLEDPFEDILQLRNVNKFWRNVIMNSTGLKQLIFLHSTARATSSINNKDNDGLAKELKSDDMHGFNPILTFGQVRPWALISDPNEKLLFLTCDSRFFASAKAQEELPAIVRDMLVSQPPSISGKLRMEWDPNWDGVQTPKMNYENIEMDQRTKSGGNGSAGITLGSLHDALAKSARLVQEKCQLLPIQGALVDLLTESGSTPDRS